jgi:asparagine synthase (glutamine-hydrolysing)
MCGFIGFIGAYDQKQKALFVDAFDSINHRGPDSSNIFESDKFLLGHKRLSIIDINSRSDQPFSDGENFLLYNGEIYNYQKLKEKLVKKYRCTFITEGDTEVLFHGLKNEGIDFLQKIDGMFSFCFVTSKGETILARDQYGQKPLFYGFDKCNNLVLGSELSSLVKLLQKKSLSKNEHAFIKYFQFGASIAPLTFYNELSQVCAGEAIIIDSSHRQIKKVMWHNLCERSLLDISIKEALTKRLKTCFVTDTPVAILSSGGIDSSALVKATSSIDTCQSTIAVHLKTMEDQRGSDIAERLETAILPLLVIDGIIKIKEKQNDGIDLLLDRFGEPFADTSYFYSEELYSLIPEEYKVIIGGDGADEVFLGYKPAPFFFLSSIVTRIVPLKVKEIVIMHSKKIGRMGFLLAALLGCKENVEKILMGFSSKELIQLAVKSYSSDEKVNIDLLSGKQVIDFYDRYLMTRLSNVFMRKSDHASMAHSKELRSPFLQGNHLEFRLRKKFFGNFIPKLKLKIYLLGFMNVFEVFRKKVGFDMSSKTNKNKSQKYIINWCFKNRNIIETIFIFDDFINLIKNIKKDNHLFRIQVFLYWLKNDYEEKM